MIWEFFVLMLWILGYVVLNLIPVMLLIAALEYNERRKEKKKLASLNAWHGWPWEEYKNRFLDR